MLTRSSQPSTSTYHTKLSTDLVLEAQGVDAMRELQRLLKDYKDISKKAANA